MAQWAAVPYRGAERAKERGYHLVNRMIGALRPQARTEWAALIDGLFTAPAAIPPKYFYDGLGCALFEAICELPEYYLTRTERSIFSAHRETIATAVGRNRQFIDLGSRLRHFPPDEALELLAQVRKLCERRGGLLIGVDVPKDHARLSAAY